MLPVCTCSNVDTLASSLCARATINHDLIHHSPCHSSPPRAAGDDDWDSVARVKSSTVGAPALWNCSLKLMKIFYFDRFSLPWRATIILKESLSARAHSARSCATTRTSQMQMFCTPSSPTRHHLHAHHVIACTVARHTCLELS
jgi:hypothetical protein